MAQETEQKASKIMETYPGEDPDSQEALEFLCLAEGAEVTHYEVLSAMTKGIKNKQFPAKVNSILNQEKNTYFCAPNWLRKMLRHSCDLASCNFFPYFYFQPALIQMQKKDNN